MLDWDLAVSIITSILAYLLTLHIKNLNLFVKLKFIESEFLLSKKCTSFLTKSSKKKSIIISIKPYGTANCHHCIAGYHCHLDFLPSWRQSMGELTPCPPKLSFTPSVSFYFCAKLMLCPRELRPTEVTSLVQPQSVPARIS